jgi:hypothetical protein
MPAHRGDHWLRACGFSAAASSVRKWRCSGQVSRLVDHARTPGQSHAVAGSCGAPVVRGWWRSAQPCSRRGLGLLRCHERRVEPGCSSRGKHLLRAPRVTAPCMPSTNCIACKQAAAAAAASCRRSGAVTESPPSVPSLGAALHTALQVVCALASLACAQHTTPSLWDSNALQYTLSLLSARSGVQ